MTLDQYLGTVAWLWIAYTLVVIFISIYRDHTYGSAYYARMPFFFIMLPIVPFAINRDLSDRAAWIASVLFWLAYPLYLWVSTSFAFNITYIGG
jgi:hypothetical protein